MGRGVPLRKSGPGSGVVARTTSCLNSSEYIWPCRSLDDAFLLVRRCTEVPSCSCKYMAELRLDSLRFLLSAFASIVSVMKPSVVCSYPSYVLYILLHQGKSAKSVDDLIETIELGFIG